VMLRTEKRVWCRGSEEGLGGAEVRKRCFGMKPFSFLTLTI